MSLDILPVKSRVLYLNHYAKFKTYKDTLPTSVTVDDALTKYILYLKSKNIKTSTIRTYISAVTTCLSNDGYELKEITTKKVTQYLQKCLKAETPKQASTFSSENILEIMRLPDTLSYLQIKVVTIFAIYCATRIGELSNFNQDSFYPDEKNGRYVVIIKSSKTSNVAEQMYIPFIDGNLNCKNIIESYLFQINEYTRLNAVEDPKILWRTIRNERFINSTIGINTMGKFPLKIAEILKLPNPSSFTGHSFRRSAATVLANHGSSQEQIMAVGRWKSIKVAHRYVEKSNIPRWNAAKNLLSGVQHEEVVGLKATTNSHSFAGISSVFHDCTFQNVTVNVQYSNSTSSAEIQEQPMIPEKGKNESEDDFEL